MTDPTTLGTDRAETLRERREDRVDHVHDIPFGEKTQVRCPDCGETTSVGIYGGEVRSYGPCWSWDCGAFHKFRRDRDAEENEPAETSETVVQTTLATVGGEC